jgi:PAS domain S-box-containing protein
MMKKALTISKKPYQVLVIEDNKGDFSLVEECLSDQPDEFVLSNAKNFAEAAIILASDKVKLDIILLDLSLPDKNGIDLICEIKMRSAGVPVIVLTGYADVAFGIKSLSMGISDYLLKDDLTAAMLYKSIVYSLERNRYILALAESESKYSQLFHLSPLPMWVVNLDTLQFIDVNEATVKNYGYSRDEFLNMTLKDIRSENEIPQMEQAIATLKHEPNKISPTILIHKKKNGELKHVEIQTAPVLYKGIRSRIVIANDVTERLEYIKAIEVQNEKLKEISWIQSHLVRAPLARIMGLIPLIAEARSGEDKVFEEILEYILISAKELDTIIMDITQKTNTQPYDRTCLKIA